MGKILISIIIAAIIVGNIFYISFSEVSANNEHLIATVSASAEGFDVQKVVIDFIDIGEGSEFTPMWKRETFVRFTEESTEERLQLEAVEVNTEEKLQEEASTPTKSPAVVPPAAPKKIMIQEEPVITEQAVEKTTASNPHSSLIAEIHRLTNKERSKAGLPPVAFDSELSVIASQHSNNMVINNFFAHEDKNGCALTCRLKNSPIKALAWAENIVVLHKSYLLSEKEMAAYLVESWMQSGTHKVNILNETYTHEGIGIAFDGATLYVTSDFAQKR